MCFDYSKKRLIIFILSITQFELKMSIFPQGFGFHVLFVSSVREQLVDVRRNTAVTLLSKSRSLIPRFIACPQHMGDSGNWHQGAEHTVMATSPEIMHLSWSVWKRGQGSQKMKGFPVFPKASILDHHVWNKRIGSVDECKVTIKKKPHSCCEKMEVCHVYSDLLFQSHHWPPSAILELMNKSESL